MAALLYTALLSYMGVAVIRDEGRIDFLLIFTLLGIVPLRLVFSHWYRNHYISLNAVVLVVAGAIRSLMVVNNGTLGLSLSTIVIFLTLRLRFVHCLVIWSVDFTVYLVTTYAFGRGDAHYWTFLFVHGLVMAVCGASSRLSERVQRRVHVCVQALVRSRAATGPVCTKMRISERT